LHGWLGIAELRNSTKARLAKLFIKDYDRAAEFKLNSFAKARAKLKKSNWTE
jgi:hypothetical protein